MKITGHFLNSPINTKGKTMRKLIIGLILITGILFSGCSDARVASANLSKAADQFEIFRRVVFYNGITNEYILKMEGYCSIKDMNGQLEVTVKLKDGVYLKHFLGLSDNVTYFAEQIESKKVSTSQYRVVFKPSVIVPNIDLE